MNGNTDADKLPPIVRAQQSSSVSPTASGGGPSASTQRFQSLLVQLHHCTDELDDIVVSVSPSVSPTNPVDPVHVTAEAQGEERLGGALVARTTTKTTASIDDQSSPDGSKRATSVPLPASSPSPSRTVGVAESSSSVPRTQSAMARQETIDRIAKRFRPVPKRESFAIANKRGEPTQDHDAEAPKSKVTQFDSQYKEIMRLVRGDNYPKVPPPKATPLSMSPTEVIAEAKRHASFSRGSKRPPLHQQQQRPSPLSTEALEKGDDSLLSVQEGEQLSPTTGTAGSPRSIGDLSRQSDLQSSPDYVPTDQQRETSTTNVVSNDSITLAFLRQQRLDSSLSPTAAGGSGGGGGAWGKVKEMQVREELVLKHQLQLQTAAKTAEELGYQRGLEEGKQQAATQIETLQYQLERSQEKVKRKTAQAMKKHLEAFKQGEKMNRMRDVKMVVEQLLTQFGEVDIEALIEENAFYLQEREYLYKRAFGSTANADRSCLHGLSGEEGASDSPDENLSATKRKSKQDKESSPSSTIQKYGLKGSHGIARTEIHQQLKLREMENFRLSKTLAQTEDALHETLKMLEALEQRSMFAADTYLNPRRKSKVGYGAVVKGVLSKKGRDQPDEDGDSDDELLEKQRSRTGGTPRLGAKKVPYDPNNPLWKEQEQARRRDRSGEKTAAGGEQPQEEHPTKQTRTGNESSISARHLAADSSAKRRVLEWTRQRFPALFPAAHATNIPRLGPVRKRSLTDLRKSAAKGESVEQPRLLHPVLQNLDVVEDKWKQCLLSFLSLTGDAGSTKAEDVIDSLLQVPGWSLFQQSVFSLDQSFLKLAEESAKLVLDRGGGGTDSFAFGSSPTGSFTGTPSAAVLHRRESQVRAVPVTLDGGVGAGTPSSSSGPGTGSPAVSRRGSFATSGLPLSPKVAGAHSGGTKTTTDEANENGSTRSTSPLMSTAGELQLVGGAERETDSIGVNTEPLGADFSKVLALNPTATCPLCLNFLDAANYETASSDDGDAGYHRTKLRASKIALGLPRDSKRRSRRRRNIELELNLKSEIAERKMERSLQVQKEEYETKLAKLHKLIDSSDDSLADIRRVLESNSELKTALAQNQRLWKAHEVLCAAVDSITKKVMASHHDILRFCRALRVTLDIPLYVAQHIARLAAGRRKQLRGYFQRQMKAVAKVAGGGDKRLWGDAAKQKVFDELTVTSQAIALKAEHVDALLQADLDSLHAYARLVLQAQETHPLRVRRARDAIGHVLAREGIEGDTLPSSLLEPKKATLSFDAMMATVLETVAERGLLQPLQRASTALTELLTSKDGEKKMKIGIVLVDLLQLRALHDSELEERKGKDGAVSSSARDDATINERILSYYVETVLGLANKYTFVEPLAAGGAAGSGGDTVEHIAFAFAALPGRGGAANDRLCFATTDSTIAIRFASELQSALQRRAQDAIASALNSTGPEFLFGAKLTKLVETVSRLSSSSGSGGDNRQQPNKNLFSFLRPRVAAHWGSVEVDECSGELYGPTVAAAAQLHRYCHDGESLVTETLVKETSCPQTDSADPNAQQPLTTLITLPPLNTPDSSPGPNSASATVDVFSLLAVPPSTCGQTDECAGVFSVQPSELRDRQLAFAQWTRQFKEPSSSSSLAAPASSQPAQPSSAKEREGKTTPRTQQRSQVVVAGGASNKESTHQGSPGAPPTADGGAGVVDGDELYELPPTLAPRQDIRGLVHELPSGAIERQILTFVVVLTKKPATFLSASSWRSCSRLLYNTALHLANQSKGYVIRDNELDALHFAFFDETVALQYALQLQTTALKLPWDSETMQATTVYSSTTQRKRQGRPEDGDGNVEELILKSRRGTQAPSKVLSSQQKPVSASRDPTSTPPADSIAETSRPHYRGLAPHIGVYTCVAKPSFDETFHRVRFQNSEAAVAQGLAASALMGEILVSPSPASRIFPLLAADDGDVLEDGGVSYLGRGTSSQRNKRNKKKKDGSVNAYDEEEYGGSLGLPLCRELPFQTVIPRRGAFDTLVLFPSSLGARLQSRSEFALPLLASPSSSTRRRRRDALARSDDTFASSTDDEDDDYRFSGDIEEEGEEEIFVDGPWEKGDLAALLPSCEDCGQALPGRCVECSGLLCKECATYFEAPPLCPQCRSKEGKCRDPTVMALALRTQTSPKTATEGSPLFPSSASTPPTQGKQKQKASKQLPQRPSSTASSSSSASSQSLAVTGAGPAGASASAGVRTGTGSPTTTGSKTVLTRKVDRQVEGRGVAGGGGGAVAPLDLDAVKKSSKPITTLTGVRVSPRIGATSASPRTPSAGVAVAKEKKVQATG